MTTPDIEQVKRDRELIAETGPERARGPTLLAAVNAMKKEA